MKGFVIFAKPPPDASEANATSTTTTRPFTLLAFGSFLGVANASSGLCTFVDPVDRVAHRRGPRFRFGTHARRRAGSHDRRDPNGRLCEPGGGAPHARDRTRDVLQSIARRALGERPDERQLDGGVGGGRRPRRRPPRRSSHAAWADGSHRP